MKDLPSLKKDLGNWRIFSAFTIKKNHYFFHAYLKTAVSKYLSSKNTLATWTGLGGSEAFGNELSSSILTNSVFPTPLTRISSTSTGRSCRTNPNSVWYRLKNASRNVGKSVEKIEVFINANLSTDLNLLPDFINLSSNIVVLNKIAFHLSFYTHICMIWVTWTSLILAFRCGAHECTIRTL